MIKKQKRKTQKTSCFTVTFSVTPQSRLNRVWGLHVARSCSLTGLGFAGWLVSRQINLWKRGSIVMQQSLYHNPDGRMHEKFKPENKNMLKKEKKKKITALVKIKSSRFGDLVVCRWGKLQAHDDFFCFLFSRVKKKKESFKISALFFFFLKKELMYKNVSVYTRKPSFFVAFLFSFGKWILWKINTFLLKIFSYNSFNIKTMGYLCFLNYVIVCYTSLSVKLSSVLLGCIADINRRCWNLKAELKTNE